MTLIDNLTEFNLSFVIKKDSIYNLINIET